MKGKMVILITLILLMGLIFSGSVALADDGGGDLLNPDNTINWVEVGLILAVLWQLYWPSLLADWTDTWNQKKLGTWKKVGYSISALVGCLIPAGKTVLKQYGGAILALIKTLIKVKFGIPTMTQRLTSTPRRL